MVVVVANPHLKGLMPSRLCGVRAGVEDLIDHEPVVAFDVPVVARGVRDGSGDADPRARQPSR